MKDQHQLRAEAEHRTTITVLVIVFIVFLTVINTWATVLIVLATPVICVLGWLATFGIYVFWLWYLKKKSRAV